MFDPKEQCLSAVAFPAALYETRAQTPAGFPKTAENEFWLMGEEKLPGL